MGDFISDSKEIKHHLTPTAAVVLPGLQALVTGLAVGVMIGSLAYIFGVDHFLAVGLLSSALGGGIAWLIALSFWRSRVYRTPQPKLPGVYGNGDVLRLQVMTHDIDTAYGRGVWAGLPVDRDTLIEIASKLAEGASFSHASLAGRHSPLSRSEYEALRDEFLARGLVYWNSPHSRNQGLSLSRAGLAAMIRLSEIGGTPPPRGRVSPRRLSDLNTITPAHTHTRLKMLADEIEGLSLEDDYIDDLWS